MYGNDNFNSNNLNNNNLNNNNINNYDLVIGFFQIFDLLLNVSQTSNDELLKKLQSQDQILNYQTKELQKQTNVYLEKIVNQNEIIIKEIKKIRVLLNKN